MWLKTSLALILCLGGQLALAEDITFNKTKRMVQEGDDSKERDCALVITGEHELVIRHRKKTDEVYARVPFDTIEELTYERATSPRTKTAIFVSPLALLSKGKKHWLTISYKVNGEGRFELLRLDKKEYQRVIAALEAKTGMKVDKIIES